MKKLIKQFLIEVYEVSGSTNIDKTEAKEELAKIVDKKISVKVDNVETKTSDYIPDAEYNDWVKIELPRLLRDKYKQYMMEKDDERTQEKTK